MFAVLLAGLMILGLGAGVLANPVSQPGLTPITPGQDFTLTIHHRILPDGTIVPGSPVGTPLPSVQGAPINGAIWEIVRLDFDADAVIPTDLTTIPASWHVASTLQTQTTGAGAFPDGQAIFQVPFAERGIYLVRLNPADVTGGNGTPEGVTSPTIFLVNIPHWHPTPAVPCSDHPLCVNDPCTDCVAAGGNWLYNVHVFPKVTTDIIFEKVGGNARTVIVDNNPDYVLLPWTFRVDIRDGLATLGNVRVPNPAYPGSGDPTMPVPDVHIRIDDTLDSRLTFYAGAAATAVRPASTTADTRPTGRFQTDDTPTWADLTIGTHFRIVHRNAANTADVVDPVAGGTVRLELLEAGRNLIGADGFVTGFMEFRFYTRVAANTTEAGWSDIPGLVENSGQLWYGPADDYEEPTEDPDGRIHALRVRKNNPENQSLPGAIFQLFRPEDIGANGQPLSTATPVMVAPATGTDGFAHFNGLQPGIYYIWETQAPTGYTLMNTAMQVQVTSANVAEFTFNATVTNTREFVLPETGGAGALLFTVLGLSLIGGSVLFLLVFMKKKKEQE